VAGFSGLDKALMLTQLVALLENKECGLSLSEISRAMNAQSSAVLPMIAFLIQKGKLIEIGPDGKYCTTCGLQSNCNLLVTRGKRYVIASQQCLTFTK
jgi:DNA-binding IclR family transcriptional regulator